MQTPTSAAGFGKSSSSTDSAIEVGNSSSFAEAVITQGRSARSTFGAKVGQNMLDCCCKATQRGCRTSRRMNRGAGSRLDTMGDETVRISVVRELCSSQTVLALTSFT